LTRNFLHIALSFILLVATTGLSFSYHYCMGRLKEISLKQDKTPCCPLSESSSDCCDHETVTLTVDDDFSLSHKFESPGAKLIFLFQLADFIDFNFALPHISGQNLFHLANGPPLHSEPIFIQFRSIIV
jgi:hypothetical protein